MGWRASSPRDLYIRMTLSHPAVDLPSARRGWTIWARIIGDGGAPKGGSSAPDTPRDVGYLHGAASSASLIILEGDLPPESSQHGTFSGRLVVSVLGNGLLSGDGFSGSFGWTHRFQVSQTALLGPANVVIPHAADDAFEFRSRRPGGYPSPQGTHPRRRFLSGHSAAFVPDDELAIGTFQHLLPQTGVAGPLLVGQQLQDRQLYFTVLSEPPCGCP